jgi:hypothetical protein
LLIISNLEDINKYKSIGITNFVLPLKDYTIGYNEFSFDEIRKIKSDVYVLSNRLLTDEDIDRFNELHIPSNVKGFILEDIGLFYELKDKNYELINFQNHLNNNYKTINIMLEDFDSLVINNDLTLKEINTILNCSNKNLVLFAFGKQMVMYSRRRLITNYKNYYGKESKEFLNIKEPIFNKNFYLRENKFGTAVFNNEYTDYRNRLKEFNLDKIKYLLFDSNFSTFEMMRDAIDGKNISNTTSGFLDRETVYKLADIKKDAEGRK